MTKKEHEERLCQETKDNLVSMIAELFELLENDQPKYKNDSLNDAISDFAGDILTHLKHPDYHEKLLSKR